MERFVGRGERNMMRVSLISIVATLLFFAPLAETAEQGTIQDANARKELEKLEREWIETQDKDKLGRIVADDFIYIDAEANVINKQQFLETASRVRVKSYEMKDLVIRLYEDIAIVTNTWSGTYVFDGKETTETLRYTDVFAKRKGGWQAISSQATRVPKPLVSSEIHYCEIGSSCTAVFCSRLSTKACRVPFAPLFVI